MGKFLEGILRLVVNVIMRVMDSSYVSCLVIFPFGFKVKLTFSVRLKFNVSVSIHFRAGIVISFGSRLIFCLAFICPFELPLTNKCLLKKFNSS